MRMAPCGVLISRRTFCPRTFNARFMTCSCDKLTLMGLRPVRNFIVHFNHSNVTAVTRYVQYITGFCACLIKVVIHGWPSAALYLTGF